MNRRLSLLYLTTLVFGHFLVDMGGGMLGPLLPTIMKQLDTRLLGATLLLMFFKLAGNIGQPIFGHLCDRSERLQGAMAFMPTLVFVPLFMGFTTQYWLLCVLLTVGGVALAVFHPTGVREVSRLPGLPRGTAMSAFLGVGFGGFAAAGFLSAWLVENAGIEWVWLPIIAGAMVTAALLVLRGVVGRAMARAGHVHAPRVTRESGYPFPAIWLTGFSVGLTSGTLVVLMPTYASLTKGGSVLPGGAAVMFYGLVGAVAGLTVGMLSDRYPRGYICAAAQVPASVFLFLFFMGEGVDLWWFSLAAVGPGATFPTLVAMSHEARGHESNLRNGLMVGGCWGVSSALLPIIGWAGDLWGLHSVLALWVVLPPITGILFYMIERTNRAARRREPAAETPVG